jgi:hypothetical protein
VDVNRFGERNAITNTAAIDIATMNPTSEAPSRYIRAAKITKNDAATTNQIKNRRVEPTWRVGIVVDGLAMLRVRGYCSLHAA